MLAVAVAMAAAALAPWLPAPAPASAFSARGPVPPALLAGASLPFGRARSEGPPGRASQCAASADADAAADATGAERPRKFAILGHNIAYSVSPAMHSAAYEALDLPHTYVLIDEEDVGEIVQSDFWRDPDFRGCSVTIPHKRAIFPHLDELSEAARAIGAVNTVIVEEGEGGRTLRGDNTDWVGIYNPLRKRLGDGTGGGGALIAGAGGTARAAAYAAKRLGLDRYFHNRTPSKAQELADEFGGTVVTALEEEGEGSLGGALKEAGATVRVVISTLPAAAGFEIPQWLVREERSLVVFDVNYKPYHTPLLRQAEAAGLDVVRGSEMLWEQGVGQFELWLDQDAPYEVMKRVVLENCLPKEDE